MVLGPTADAVGYYLSPLWGFSAGWGPRARRLTVAALFLLWMVSLCFTRTSRLRENSKRHAFRST